MRCSMAARRDPGRLSSRRYPRREEPLDVLVRLAPHAQGGLHRGTRQQDGDPLRARTATRRRNCLLCLICSAPWAPTKAPLHPQIRVRIDDPAGQPAATPPAPQAPGAARAGRSPAAWAAMCGNEGIRRRRGRSVPPRACSSPLPAESTGMVNLQAQWDGGATGIRPRGTLRPGIQDQVRESEGNARGSSTTGTGSGAAWGSTHTSGARPRLAAGSKLAGISSGAGCVTQGQLIPMGVGDADTGWADPAGRAAAPSWHEEPAAVDAPSVQQQPAIVAFDAHRQAAGTASPSRDGQGEPSARHWSQEEGDQCQQRRQSTLCSCSSHRHRSPPARYHL